VQKLHVMVLNAGHPECSPKFRLWHAWHGTLRRRRLVKLRNSHRESEGEMDDSRGIGDPLGVHAHPS
jgi:hypothetical protein